MSYPSREKHVQSLKFQDKMSNEKRTDYEVMGEDREKQYLGAES